MNPTPVDWGEGTMLQGQRLQVWPLPWADKTFQVGEVYEIPSGSRLFIAVCRECQPQKRFFMFEVLQITGIPDGWKVKH
jgi:hypothetical protein